MALEVLVIDDKPQGKVIVRKILEGAGLTVCWCRDWEETEDLLDERFDREDPLPDVVLVDMFFEGEHCILGLNPGVEGLLIIEKLVKKFETSGLKPPPIIGFTGWERYMEPRAIIEYGASDFITEAEYKRPNHFARRLIRSVMEAQFENSFNPPKGNAIQKIEENIVSKALKNKNNDLKQAANLLRWPLDEVKKIAERLEDTGALR
jgi:DNA-binding NtrC family response regulator